MGLGIARTATSTHDWRDKLTQVIQGDTTLTHLTTTDDLLLLAYAAPTDDHPKAGSAYGLTTLFQGRAWHGELGMYYYRNRWYLPEAGVFAERDPESFLDSPSLYQALGANPSNRVDPTGRLLLLARYLGGGPKNFVYKLEFQTMKRAFEKYILGPIVDTAIPEGKVKDAIKLVKGIKGLVGTAQDIRHAVMTDPSQCEYFVDRAIDSLVYSPRLEAARFEAALKKSFEYRVPGPDRGWYYSRESLDTLDWVVQVVAIRWLHDKSKKMTAFGYRSVMRHYDIHAIRDVADRHGVDLAPGPDSPQHPMTLEQQLGIEE